jgi:hypothetical protein
VWFALFVSRLADNYIGAEGAGMLAEPLGKLTALQELLFAGTGLIVIAFMRLLLGLVHVFLSCLGFQWNFDHFSMNHKSPSFLRQAILFASAVAALSCPPSSTCTISRSWSCQ